MGPGKTADRGGIMEPMTMASEGQQWLLVYTGGRAWSQQLGDSGATERNSLSRPCTNAETHTIPLPFCLSHFISVRLPRIPCPHNFMGAGSIHWCSSFSTFHTLSFYTSVNSFILLLFSVSCHQPLSSWASKKIRLWGKTRETEGGRKRETDIVLVAGIG